MAYAPPQVVAICRPKTQSYIHQIDIYIYTFFLFLLLVAASWSEKPVGEDEVWEEAEEQLEESLPEWRDKFLLYNRETNFANFGSDRSPFQLNDPV